MESELKRENPLCGWLVFLGSWQRLSAWGFSWTQLDYRWHCTTTWAPSAAEVLGVVWILRSLFSDLLCIWAPGPICVFFISKLLLCTLASAITSFDTFFQLRFGARWIVMLSYFQFLPIGLHFFSFLLELATSNLKKNDTVRLIHVETIPKYQVLVLSKAFSSAEVGLMFSCFFATSALRPFHDLMALGQRVEQWSWMGDGERRAQ